MILALAGGVGGAKLAHGLQQLDPGALITVVNTGDDFHHLGLPICPDLDTVMYTLSGRANPTTGWGLAGETWSFLGALERLGGDTWFRLGDQDLATHIERGQRLGQGQTLSDVTAALCTALGVPSRIIPMSDTPVSTVALTDEGHLAFQEYFVKRQCEPRISGLEFNGADKAVPSPGFAQCLQDPNVEQIIICPSNPFLSLGPILAIPGVKSALRNHPAPVIAVSPIVGGSAVKGPAAKMMKEFGIQPSAAAVAHHYGDLIDGFVLDEADRALADTITGPARLVCDTIMRDDVGRAQLAERVVAFGRTLTA